jgi:uncharacterized protein (DUF1810 family)
VAESDRFNLQRFVDAQNPVYTAVCWELRAGHKESHWMWFIFPQIAGLGSSSTAKYYAISGLAEAKAYLSHPVLGPRLVECCCLVTGVEGRSAEDIFGYPDYLKFRSSLTLFGTAAPDAAPFQAALEKYFEGKPDLATVERLRER